MHVSSTSAQGGIFSQQNRLLESKISVSKPTNLAKPLCLRSCLRSSRAFRPEPRGESWRSTLESSMSVHHEARAKVRSSDEGVPLTHGRGICGSGNRSHSHPARVSARCGQARPLGTGPLRLLRTTPVTCGITIPSSAIIRRAFYTIIPNFCAQSVQPDSAKLRISPLRNPLWKRSAFLQPRPQIKFR
jgi:hypothetical protein